MTAAQVQPGDKVPPLDEHAPDDMLIVGTGAMACLFAARLAARGTKVTLLGTWPQAIEALQTRGVRLVENDGSSPPCGPRPSEELMGLAYRSYPVRAVTDPSDCRGARLALVLVKTWQTDRAARQLSACLASDGLALTLQNGLGNREILSQTLGPSRVALGVTTLGATLLGPGYVRAGGDGIISMGAHPQMDTMVRVLRQAGFSVETGAETESLVWSKLVINAAINPLTALLRVANGELLARPTARELMGQEAGEAAALAEALGIRLTFQDPVAAAESVALRTASNCSSMLNDILRGAPSEIDAICGAIVAEGERRGVATPVNRLLYQLVKALAGKGEGP